MGRAAVLCDPQPELSLLATMLSSERLLTHWAAGTIGWAGVPASSADVDHSTIGPIGPGSVRGDCAGVSPPCRSAPRGSSLRPLGEGLARLVLRDLTGRCVLVAIALQARLLPRLVLGRHPAEPPLLPLAGLLSA